MGQYTVTGLGVDAGSDSGPAEWRMSQHLDIKLWYDKNGDGDFDDAGELIVQDKLANIACTKYELGIIPGGQRINVQGGGWGSYFKYHTGDPPLLVPLMYGQYYPAGYVTVSNDATNLYINYNTTGTGWTMAETHVYVGKDPPAKLAPGTFPYAHDPLPGVTTDSYVIPLSAINGGVTTPSTDLYIATHATGTDGETAWGRGAFRKFKIEVHLQQVEDPAWATIDYDGDGDIDADDAQYRWWPTNALQGDRSTFDIVFYVNQP